MSQVVSDLLAPNQGETGVVRLNLVLSTVQSLFDKAEAELAVEGRKRPVEFRCEPGLPWVLVDPRRLVQVIAHLVRCFAEISLPGTALLVEGRWWEGRPAITVGTADSDVALRGCAQGPEPPDATYRGPNGVSMEDDLRVVISRTLLDAHGLTLEFEPLGDSAGTFWFPLPVSLPSGQTVEAVPGPAGGPTP